MNWWEPAGRWERMGFLSTRGKFRQNYLIAPLVADDDDEYFLHPLCSSSSFLFSSCPPPLLLYYNFSSSRRIYPSPFFSWQLINITCLGSPSLWFIHFFPSHHHDSLFFYLLTFRTDFLDFLLLLPPAAASADTFDAEIFSYPRLLIPVY